MLMLKVAISDERRDWRSRLVDWNIREKVLDIYKFRIRDSACESAWRFSIEADVGGAYEDAALAGDSGLL